MFQPQNNTFKSNELKKPLGDVFKEAVGLREKRDESENEEGNGEVKELKKRLKDLENEIKVLNESNLGESGVETESMTKIKLGGEVSEDKTIVKLSKLFSYDKPHNLGRRNVGSERVGKVSEDEVMVEKLSALFPSELEKKGRSRKAETVVCKELSPDMIVFARHLFEKGYFKNANFLPRYTFDATRFEDNYSRAFLICAAQKFGKDHQEISKWISASDVKKIALFGCPSLSKKPLMAAKALRIFFSIPEDTVCSKCVLKESCKFVNQSIWKGQGKKMRLDLSAVMNVITLYAMEEVPAELVVPDEIKTSVSRLLEEVMKLSKTVS
ncbi:DNA polymerase zeta subunit [Heracleum sosnowskyi]|uniref:DNA polymerase zeta subunit n=1 Tax=Heracleum sosnowskyi TaxID=360622 RepID=A0AAD8JI14_9APIA|nr:DNA polymerase zeta subunit [Heracleum sosnowskyi]